MNWQRTIKVDELQRIVKKYLPWGCGISPRYEVPNKGGELENGKKKKKSPLKVFLLSAEESWVLERKAEVSFPAFQCCITKGWIWDRRTKEKALFQGLRDLYGDYYICHMTFKMFGRRNKAVSDYVGNSGQGWKTMYLSDLKAWQPYSNPSTYLRIYICMYIHMYVVYNMSKS